MIGMDSDHRNLDRSDNRRANLRLATPSQNRMNRRRLKSLNKTSRWKGVGWCKDRAKWRARIRVNKRLIHLGRFANEIDAAKVYNNAAIKYHREFARLNEI